MYKNNRMQSVFLVYVLGKRIADKDKCCPFFPFNFHGEVYRSASPSGQT